MIGEVTILNIGGREFRIGNPPVRVYRALLQFVAGLFSRGYVRTVKDLGALAKLMSDDLPTSTVIANGVMALEDHDLLRLTAILLHFEKEEEGIAWLEQVGWDPSAFVEALAANAEHIDLKGLVKNAQRLARLFTSLTQEETEA